MYWKELMHQCSEIGIGSLGIVAIISVFIGAVSAVQTAYQLVSPVIPKSTIAQIVRDTLYSNSPYPHLYRISGVVGSKIASELGNMRVSEQIDALEIMGINTKAYSCSKDHRCTDRYPHACGHCCSIGHLGRQDSRCSFRHSFCRNVRPRIDHELYAVQRHIRPGKSLHIRIHHIKCSCLLWLPCTGRSAGDRKIKYASSSNKLYHDITRRLFIGGTLTMTKHDRSKKHT